MAQNPQQKQNEGISEARLDEWGALVDFYSRSSQWVDYSAVRELVSIGDYALREVRRLRVVLGYIVSMEDSKWVIDNDGADAYDIARQALGLEEEAQNEQ